MQCGPSVTVKLTQLSLNVLVQESCLADFMLVVQSEFILFSKQQRRQNVSVP